MKIHIDAKVLEKLNNKINSQIPRLVGEMLVSNYKMNITNGIDINGKNLLPNKLKENKVLLKSGRLRNSIRVSQVRGLTVYIIANTPYAQIQNSGGVINQITTDKQKAFFWSKFRATGDIKYKHMATGQSLKITIPKRHFMGVGYKQKLLIQNTIIRNLK